ncbi:hypothetical protein BAUCODRAFT_68159 [Baudoinia panamericana UAMH 10762]|uniref:Pex19 protein n=1 Tax=Baudoinia panamericana (strain UAMH 10762) TaxID=717646 RepID=M2NEP3_BAUPA|nr:uncharacterized protein BAUCODRAFT_68159 [Baudoinia panamericana UAMH 10762]EMC97719.1 hypothetical protein BAUCODRAFT_68159 [Baudoinia panamericana UAMH 10762]
MSSLISELDANPEMQRQFETMMQELIAAGAAPSDHEAGQHLKDAARTVPVPDPSPVPQPGKKAAGEKDGSADFSSTIRRTMERMQHSDSTASTAATARETSEEDLLAQMLKELQSGGAGEGEGGEEDFNKMLLNMMSQLTHKEILYDPMKELHEMFPGWMERNREGSGKGKVGKEDMERYEEQQRLVGEIVARFERKGYSDDDERDREYIVERMQKMQAAGSPPPDLVGDMSAAQEALGDLDAGCPTQ